jgi:hypothetical protein
MGLLCSATRRKTAVCICSERLVRVFRAMTGMAIRTAVMLDAVSDGATAAAGSPIYEKIRCNRQTWEMDWLRCSD